MVHLITNPIAKIIKLHPPTQKASNHEWLEALILLWRERVGIEPTQDGVTAPHTVLKTGETTRPHALPYDSILP